MELYKGPENQYKTYIVIFELQRQKEGIYQ